MRYEGIRRGIFLDRPNRFIAHVRLGEEVETVHVKNTGRCRELLVPGAAVILEEGKNPARKTKYDLICVYKGRRLINMDSQVPNQAAREWIEGGGLFPEKVEVQREKTYGNSRFDLYVQSPVRKAFIEVKGVTLEEEGIARFPDAPTLRGVKHLEELIRCRQEGHEAYILFVIQMKDVQAFEPNWETHEEFGRALQRARDAGVRILVRDCLVEEDSIEIRDPVPLRLDVPKSL
ncbi:MAG: DNA/RNA nuclease SfsA [Eubacteriales bacterium]|nr:DNA/RNA nuclease SfsA [Eubacteriales bacterium]